MVVENSIAFVQKCFRLELLHYSFQKRSIRRRIWQGLGAGCYHAAGDLRTWAVEIDVKAVAQMCLGANLHAQTSGYVFLKEAELVDIHSVEAPVEIIAAIDDGHVKASVPEFEHYHVIAGRVLCLDPEILGLPDRQHRPPVVRVAAEAFY